MFEAISFSGDGIKGINQLGFLLRLSEYIDYCTFYNNIKEINGSSIGSIISLLFSTGRPILDLCKMCTNINIESIICPNIVNIMHKGGFDDCVNIINTLEYLLDKCDLLSTITFSEHYKTYNKIYTISSYNLTKKHQELFNVNTAPNMKIIDAIRLSISIPILFTTPKYNGDEYVDDVILSGAWFKISDKRCIVLKTFEDIYTTNEEFYTPIKIMRLILATLTKNLDQTNTLMCVINSYKVDPSDTISIYNYLWAGYQSFEPKLLEETGYS